jgi:hypothetical protein
MAWRRLASGELVTLAAADGAATAARAVRLVADGAELLVDAAGIEVTMLRGFG